MQMWLMWLIFTIAWINPNIWDVVKKWKKFGEWLNESYKILIIGVAFSYLWIYFLMPTAIWPVVIPQFFLMVFILNVIRVVKDFDGAERPLGTTVVVSLLMLIFTGYVTDEAYYAEDIAKIPNITIAPLGTSTDRISIENAKLIPKQSFTKWSATNAMGVLGTKNRVGEAFPRMENGSIIWYVNMEYDGDLWKAWKYRDIGTDGYIKARAGSSNEQPDRENNFSLKYIPSAVFGYNLDRLIYNQYPQYYQGKHMFQLDDEKKLIFVTVLMEPTYGRTGEIPIGVVVSYPESGKIIKYDLDKVPSYIQRTVDEKLLESYIAWWGRYQKGYWNYITSQDGVIEPSGEVSLSKTTSGEIQISRGDPEVYFVIGNDGIAHLYSVMVGPATPMSITGFIMADIRDISKITYYRTEGYLSDIAAAKSIQQDKQVSNIMGYHVNQPIRYEYMGVPTYVGTILGSNQEVKMFGIRNSRTDDVYIGEDFNEVLARYEQAITGKVALPGKTAATANEILTNVSIKYSNNKTQELSLPQGTVITISN